MFRLQAIHAGYGELKSNQEARRKQEAQTDCAKML